MFALTLFVFTGAVGAEEAASARPEFEQTPPVEANEGYVELKWRSSLEPGAAFELQQAATAAFEDSRMRYEGPDRGFFASGLRGGSHFFRVRAQGDGGWTEWSEVLEVRVDYPSRTRVVLLMIAGAVIFVATVGGVVIGTLKARRERGDRR